MHCLTLLVALLFFTSLHHVHAQTEKPNPHVCIIGGGIAAASTAHFLTESVFTPRPRITILEKASGLGGRVSTLNVNTSKGNIKIEAGASIIASSNELMAYFTDLLKLSKKDTPSRTFGLWDGTKFVTRSHPTSKLRTQLKMFLRYGRSVLKMGSFVEDLTKSYSTVYPVDDAPWPGCSDVSSLFAGAPNLFNLSQMVFAKVVEENFNTLFGHEMVAAITRVNYGQDPGQMNGFSGSVGLAGSGGGLWSVEGGNQQIVEGLIRRAAVEVLLETPVERVTVSDIDDKRKYQLHSDASVWMCDAVVMTVPFELAGIELPQDIAKKLDIGRKFHATHTTFVRGFLNEDTFGSDPPETVFTIEEVSEPFTAIGLAVHGNNSEEAPVFKIFGKQPLDDQALKRIFKDGAFIIAYYPWLAYPKFSPPEKFPPFHVDEGSGGFFYTSPIDSLGSAMEQSAVSGANAAALVRNFLDLQEESIEAGTEKDEL